MSWSEKRASSSSCAFGEVCFKNYCASIGMQIYNLKFPEKRKNIDFVLDTGASGSLAVNYQDYKSIGGSDWNIDKATIGSSAESDNAIYQESYGIGVLVPVYNIIEQCNTYLDIKFTGNEKKKCDYIILLKGDSLLTIEFCATFGIQMIVDSRIKSNGKTIQDRRCAFLEYDPNITQRSTFDYDEYLI